MKMLMSLIMSVSFAAGTHAQQSVLTHRAELPEILGESSDLFLDGSGMWTLPDGKIPAIYRIDTATGQVLQEVKVEGVSFVDAEAITADGNYIYIGDIGNNRGVRKQYQIVRIDKTSLGTEKTVSARGEVITFSYPEQFCRKQRKRRHNSEALLIMGDSIYVFTKRLHDYYTHLYAFPKAPGTYTAKEINRFNAGGLVTGVSLHPSKKELALIGYQSGDKNAFIWIFRDIKGTNLLSGAATQTILLPGKLNWQTEGIAYTRDNRLFITCETTKDVKASLYVVERGKLIKD